MKNIESIHKFINQISRLSPQTWLSMIAHATEIQLAKDNYFVKHFDA